MEETYNNQIYDRIFKKVLTLSGKAVINFINGLFGTDYPIDSTIDYNWTEFHDDKLKRTLADTIITINRTHCYHIEAQTYEDGTIVFRVFEYGYRHAERHKTNDHTGNRLIFPEPKILYIYADGSIPDNYELTLDFGSQGNFVYRVPTVQLKDISISELNNRKMVILIPFYLMSLRKELKKERTPENLERLKKLIFNDIIGSIEKNLELGNITHEDADRLKQMTQLLYHYLYAHYHELEEVSDMTDESLLLPYDLFIRKYNIDNLYETLERVQHLDEDEERLRKTKKQLEAEKKQIVVKKQQIETEEQQLEANKKQFETNKKQLEANKKQLETNKKQLEVDKEQFEVDKEQFEVNKEQFEDNRKQLETDRQQLKAREQQFEVDKQQFEDNRKQLETDKQQLEDNRLLMVKQVAAFVRQLDLSEEECCKALGKILNMPEDEVRKFL